MKDIWGKIINSIKDYKMTSRCHFRPVAPFLEIPSSCPISDIYLSL